MIVANVLHVVNVEKMYELSSEEKKSFILFINEMIEKFPKIKKKHPNFYNSVLNYNQSYVLSNFDKIIKYSIFFEAILLTENDNNETYHLTQNHLTLNFYRLRILSLKGSVIDNIFLSLTISIIDAKFPSSPNFFP